MQRIEGFVEDFRARGRRSSLEMAPVVSAHGQDLARFTGNQGADFGELVNGPGGLTGLERVAFQLVETLSFQNSIVDRGIDPLAHEDGCGHHSVEVSMALKRPRCDVRATPPLCTTLPQTIKR